MRAIINIDVPDLAVATDFYCRAVGLKLSRLIDDDVAELVGASSIIYLLLATPGSAPGKTPGLVRDFGRHWTPVHVDFVVDDLDAAASRALAAGAKQESACVEWRGSRCITFCDPFGHGFCLIEFAACTYSTDDVEAVQAAASEKRRRSDAD